jgi:hypothetical protein
MKAYDFKVLLEPDETGGYVATCPSLPGCYSQGDTVDGALGQHPRGRRALPGGHAGPRRGHPGSFPSPGRKRRHHTMTPRLPAVSGREAIRALASGQGTHGTRSRRAIAGAAARPARPALREVGMTTVVASGQRSARWTRHA